MQSVVKKVRKSVSWFVESVFSSQRSAFCCPVALGEG